MTLAIGTVLSGRYEIIEKIGTGGMAVVYRAKDQKLDRNVTVKVLKEEFVGDEDFKARFKTEARAAAKLSHPNIVNVYDVGEDNGVQYIVMEYVHGDTLKQVIINSAPFDTVVTLSIAVQMASALAHAHKNGVIHRDIKPHNILVSVDGTIKITDFGIARAAAVSTVTTTSNALGSVYYFSPEQARGGYVDSKSDIYSLGITMYEMLTGKVPYEGETSVAIALKHLNNELPDIRQFNSNVSDTIQNIVLKATQKKKDDRYDNVELLLADLKRALSEESISYQAKPVVMPVVIPNTEKADVTSLDDASATAATVGVAMATEKGTMLAKDDKPEIKVEITNGGKKEYDIPERAVGFQKYSKKFKISKDDDFEPEIVPSKGMEKMSVKKQPHNEVDRKTSERTRKAKNMNNSEDEYYRDKERKVTIAAIITAVIIIIIISAFGVKFIRGEGIFGSGNKKTVTSSMPDFTGKTLEDAQAEAKDLGITLNVSDEQYTNDYAEGQIMSQSIEKGQSISKDDVIDVVVSLGTKGFTMPDVVYETEEDAVAEIKKLGGKQPTIEYEFDDTVPAAVVLSQSPSAQTEIDSGTKITLTVSKGSETKTVTVEDYTGKQLSDVQKQLTEAGLTLGTVTENNTADGEKGKIISQSLTANKQVDRDTQIDFVVVGEKSAEEPVEETPDTTAPTTPSSEKTSSKYFTVEAPASYVNENSISVKMLKITNGSSVDVVYNETKAITDFPLNVTLSGSGQAEIQLYIDNVYQWSQIVDFSEGAN
ncbi:MAG: Stk1 family PASTA domain-containing Ser/Thr kinase [Lachnospiraceae bacterium]|nr:Stk1 family PASTA domain-containing Ser/Thr kinase [Lachnospiraceae bacterium]